MADEREDEELDICSEKFDPLKALNAGKAVIPIPDAPTLDNLAKFETLIAQSKGDVRIDQVRLCYYLKKKINT